MTCMRSLVKFAMDSLVQLDLFYTLIQRGKGNKIEFVSQC